MTTPHMQIGFTATYINDYGFAYFCEIPMEAAVVWLRRAAPTVGMDVTGRIQPLDLTWKYSADTDADKNGWLNKRFVVVAIKDGKAIALNKHDDNFAIYVSR